MASISRESNGRKRIEFVKDDGSRRRIRLGKATALQAETARRCVEDLLGGGKPGCETAEWLAGLDGRVYKRVVKAMPDVVKPRQDSEPLPAVSIGAVTDAFIERMAGKKPNTLMNVKQARKWLVDCFGEARDIDSIGPADAEDFRVFMQKKGLGENTIRRHTGRARQFFRAAMRRGEYHKANPFEGMDTRVRSNKAREFFIDSVTAQKVLNACPNAAWRLLFSLSRFGGLRIPSELVGLRWGDVDFEHGRILVHSPKTEHHEGKESRYIPMFPELRKPLLDVFTEAEPGAEFVVTRHRDKNANLRTHLERIIKKAGVKPWPKLWHNLRSSRQTELSEIFPSHVVCGLPGNNAAIAQEHYLQIRDSHFAQAIGELSNSAGEKAAQHIPEPAGTDKKLVGAMNEKSPESPNHSEKTGLIDTPGRNRTCNREIRNLVLCPVELRGLS
jgi:integrase